MRSEEFMYKYELGDDEACECEGLCTCGCTPEAHRTIVGEHNGFNYPSRDVLSEPTPIIKSGSTLFKNVAEEFPTLMSSSKLNTKKGSNSRSYSKGGPTSESQSVIESHEISRDVAATKNDLSLNQTKPVICVQTTGTERGVSTSSIPKVNAWSGLFNSTSSNMGSCSKKKLSKGLKKFTVGYDDSQVKIPLEISKSGLSVWEHALVGSCVDRSMSFYHVKTWAHKLWGDNLENVVTLDNGFFIFKMKNEEALQLILEDGPYYFGGKLIIIKKWHPGMQLTKDSFSTVPIWVKFFNVPLELWTEVGLSYIASVIGNPLYLDEITQCHSRLTFARICIEVEASKVIL